MRASSIEYTDVLIRRHFYRQTMHIRPPFVIGYGAVGESDQVGERVSGFQIGERVADMTVVRVPSSSFSVASPWKRWIKSSRSRSRIFTLPSSLQT